MKNKVFCLLVASAFMLPLFAQETNLRIGSYNLRMQQLDKNTLDSWDLRHSRCVQSILDNNFDVFGVQELTDFAETELAQDLFKEYAMIFFSPYKADGSGGKANGIVYKKKRFKLVDYHYFWISDTPYEVSKNDHYNYGGREGSYIRGGACAVFKDKTTGKMFFFMNHHGILNKEENLKYAHVLVDMEKKYNPKGYPSFLVGDFNARVEHPSHQIWREHWNDSAEIAGERQCTMNAFSPDPASWDTERHIDFIYYRNIDAPVQYVVNQQLYDGRCASDHFPVWADFMIK